MFIQTETNWPFIGLPPCIALHLHSHFHPFSRSACLFAKRQMSVTAIQMLMGVKEE
jgi:hypothetical protein